MAGRNDSVSYIFEAVDNMSRNLETMRKGIQGLDKSMETTQKTASTFSEKMTTLGSKLQSFGRSMRFVSLALTGVGVASVRNFSKIEAGLVNVHGLMRDDAIKKYGDDYKKLHTEALMEGFAIDEVNKALFDSVSALGAGAQSMSVFKQAQILAKAGATDLAVAVDGLTSIVNVYGRETTNANEVANAFYTSQVFGKTTVQELAASVGRVAPQAKAAGVSFQELLATMSALTLGGLGTEEAATSLRGVLSSLIKPGNEAKQILDELGIASGVTGIQQQGLGKILLKLGKAFEVYPDHLARAIPNIRAFTGVTALGEDKIKLISEAMQQMIVDTEEGSGMMAQFGRVNKTTADALEEIRGSITVLTSELGEQMGPVVNDISRGLQQFTKWFKQLSPEAKQAITIFGAIGASLSTVAIGLGLVLKFLGGIIVLKVGAIIAGISAAIVGLSMGIKYVSDFIQTLDDKIANVIYRIGTFISKVGAIPAPIRFLASIFAGSADARNWQTYSYEPKTLSWEQFAAQEAKVDVNINAPEDVVKKWSINTNGNGINLGRNYTPIKQGAY